MQFEGEYGLSDHFEQGGVYQLIDTKQNGDVYIVKDKNGKHCEEKAFVFKLLPESEVVEIQKHDHYFVDVSHLQKMDVYRVLERFKVTCPVLQHVSKKALCAGNRKHKDLRRDIQDMIDSLTRKLEMMNEDNANE